MRSRGIDDRDDTPGKDLLRPVVNSSQNLDFRQQVPEPPYFIPATFFRASRVAFLILPTHGILVTRALVIWKLELFLFLTVSFSFSHCFFFFLYWIFFSPLIPLPSSLFPSLFLLNMFLSSHFSLVSSVISLLSLSLQSCSLLYFLVFLFSSPIRGLSAPFLRPCLRVSLSLPFSSPPALFLSTQEKLSSWAILFEFNRARASLRNETPLPTDPRTAFWRKTFRSRSEGNRACSEQSADELSGSRASSSDRITWTKVDLSSRMGTSALPRIFSFVLRCTVVEDGFRCTPCPI